MDRAPIRNDLHIQASYHGPGVFLQRLLQQNDHQRNQREEYVRAHPLGFWLPGLLHHVRHVLTRTRQPNQTCPLQQ